MVHDEYQLKERQDGAEQMYEDNVGFIGTLMFFFGFLACIIVGGSKIIALCNNTPAPLVTDSPYFYIALTMMILGTQLFLAGFLGELISRNAMSRNNYQIEKTL